MMGALAILCADVTGGEKLYERLPETEAVRAIGRCEKRIAQTVEGFHGRLAKCPGSRVMAFFSDADDALQSAIELQRRVATLPPLSGVALGVRVGVCLGHASNEMRFFDNNANNAAISLSAFAEPGQVLISVPKRASGFQWNNRAARSRPEVDLCSGKRRLGVFEIDWRGFGAARARPAAEAAAAERLYLHVAGTTIELGAERPLLSIGRLAGCGLHLNSNRCSRIHASIERRGDAFVLIDQSTNGTFVTPEGGSERTIRRRELALSGRGRICFGGPSAADGAECLDYAVGSRPAG